MDIQNLVERAGNLAETARDLAHQSERLESVAKQVALQAGGAQLDPFIIGLTVFVLACFVGYYVVWRVTPALHSPLMSVTNAISSVIIVGALIAAGPSIAGVATSFGFLAVILASINIFGGFIVTQRMLQMFAKSK